MWVDNFLSRCAWTIAVFFTHWWHGTVKERTLVGADVAIRSADVDGHSLPLYVSFSAPPDDETLDDFGISHDSVFRYLGGVRDVVRIAWRGSGEGWRIVYAELIYASPVDSI